MGRSESPIQSTASDGNLGIELVNSETRDGFFRNQLGMWLPDRRTNADRRADVPVDGALMRLRSTLRRQSDLAMLRYVEG